MEERQAASEGGWKAPEVNCKETAGDKWDVSAEKKGIAGEAWTHAQRFAGEYL